ncbi:hypothetical protein ABW21_db0205565 [Orbilia brochopaga]|nr:hypothetical protein ABW21_db0205565 [Drechslerella brochopaga]
MRGAAKSIKSTASLAAGGVEGAAYGYRGLASIMSAIRRRFGNGEVAEVVPVEIPPSGDVRASGVTTKTKITAGLGFALMIAATGWYVYSSWEAWEQIGKMDHLERAKLVTGGLQAVGGFVFGAYKAAQVWKGWDQLPGGQNVATELEHSVAGQLEMVTRKRANSMDPRLAKQAKNPGSRPRLNTMTINKLGQGAAKPSNISEAMLSSKKPSSWTKFKAGMKSTHQKISAKMKFNATETGLRCFAVAISGVMLVLACISAAQNWDKMDDVEKWLTVIGLVIQLASLILEAVVLFAAISPLWSMGIAAVGFLLGLYTSYYQAKREPPEGPVTKWFREKGRPFLDKLSLPPPSAFVWTVEQPQYAIGKQSTVTIRGTPFGGDRSMISPNLSAIKLMFTCGKNTSSTLFDVDAGKEFSEKSDPEQPLADNQVYIRSPSSLKDTCDTALIDTSLSGTTIKQYTCSIELKDRGQLAETYGADKIPYIDIAPGAGSIRIELRGKISKMGVKPKTAETQEEKIPEWAKYTITVQEQYSSDDGTLKEVRESFVDVEKVGLNPTEPQKAS